MNRLIIIGNGFDLAHGLPTSYKDFIDDFWINFSGKCNTEVYKKFVYVNVDYSKYYNVWFTIYDDYKIITDYKTFKSNLSKYCTRNNFTFYDEDCVAQVNGHDFFRIVNDFFLKINNESIEKWVDIENLYYSELKRILKSKSSDITIVEKSWIKKQKKEVKKLNEEFECVKELFENYLINNVEKNYELFKTITEENTWTKFYHILKPMSISNNEHNLIDEFNNKDDKNEILEFFKAEKLHGKGLNKKCSFFLNFNYTTSLDKYVKSFKDGENEVYLNQIHGRINDKKNMTNFGFGDEMDEDYKMIENINDNEYLRNFKSFQYLQNSNYSDLLSFIDNEKFQVIIMGHSCGLSDRTLLNTIFEHNNCRSIKVFYYQWKDKVTDEIKDNYTELIQNISRHFNNKKLMRERVVNKTLCKPLPQIKLPKKEN